MTYDSGNKNSHESLDYEKSKAIRGEILSVNLTDYLGKRFGCVLFFTHLKPTLQHQFPNIHFNIINYMKGNIPKLKLPFLEVVGNQNSA
jgi:hypothetical protein